MSQRLLVMPRLGFLWMILLSATPGSASYMVTGRFQYQDREFGIDGFTGTVTARPIRFADVRVLSGSTELARGATGEDGIYSIAVPDSSARSVTAICITSTSQTPLLLLAVYVANDDYSFGDYYSVASNPVEASGSGSVDMGTTIALKDNDAGRAFNVFDVALDSLQFVALLSAAGAYPDKKLTIIWRLTHPRGGSFFSTNSQDDRWIFIDGTAAYDDTVISHEIGHYIDSLYFKSDSPGGVHYIGDGNQDIRLSWGEGLATFLGSSARQFKGYARPEIYVNTDGKDGLSFSYEIELLTGTASLGSRTGSTNEIAVSAALWDIVDGSDTADSTPGADDDPLQRPFSDVWKVLAQYLPTLTRPGISVESFWDGWFSAQVNNGFLSEMQTVFSTVNGIEFIADAQEPDDSAAASPAMTMPERPVLASGPKVVINELEMGSVDAVELYNAGDSEADLTGWTLDSSAAGQPPATFVVPPFRLAPGAFVILSEALGVNTSFILFFGINISWSNGNSGACALRNSLGQGVDFARWGSSTELVPSGTSFTGANPASPESGKTLGRSFAGTDTDTGSDWTAQGSTLGTFNLSGQEKHHTFYPAADVDYAAFNATAGRSYLLETLNLHNGADTIIDLIDASATILVSNDDFGTTKASRLAWTALFSGKYFVRVRRFDGVSNFAQYGSYELRGVQSASPLTISLPDTLTVSRAGQGGRFQRLADAVEAASNGDLIEILDSSTYVENPTVIGKSITLKAANGKSPVLDGRGGSAMATLNITSKTMRIEGLTILGGSRGIRINSGDVTIANTVVYGASDPAGYSDGIQLVGAGSNATIINSTIINNDRLGIGVFRDAGVKVANCILQNNALADLDSDLASSPNLVVKNSLLGDSRYAGRNGNIKADPQFLDPSNGNFRLKASSSAIDAGDPSDPDLPAVDADGIPRSLDGKGAGKPVPDMGAYEYLAPGTLTASAVFPQIAAGGFNPAYRTSIVGMNTNSVPATAQLSLTKSSGEPLSITVLNSGKPEAEAPAIVLGAGDFTRGPNSTFNISIPPSGTVRLEAAGSGKLLSGYARFLSSVPIDGMALFKTVRGETILSEAGVGLSKRTRNFTVYVDNVGGAYAGYAVANCGAAPASVSMTLRDRFGKPLEAKGFTLPAGQHIARFAAGDDQFPTNASAGFEGTIEFSSDQDLAAVALRYDNLSQDVFSTVPVLVDEASSTLYFPQVADGGGYRTSFILVNPTSSPATARLEFFASNGTPLSLPIGGIFNSSHDVQLSAKGVARFLTDGSSEGTEVGWVRVTSPFPIGGSAIFQTISGSQILSEAGVASSPLATHFTAYVESLGSAQSGLAICNPNQITAAVTLKLRDPRGKEVAATSFSLKPSEHVAKFFTEKDWFTDKFSQFQGTLEVLATVPVSAVALRYDNPEQNVFATLPVIVVP